MVEAIALVGLIVSMVMGVVAFLALMIGYFAIVNGWVLTKLWLWFVVPTFGFHELGLVQAIGLAMVVSFLTVRSGSFRKVEEGKTDWSKVTAGLLQPFITLLFGWVIHQFM